MKTYRTKFAAFALAGLLMLLSATATFVLNTGTVVTFTQAQIAELGFVAT